MPPATARDVALSSPDKVLFPEAGVTKGEVAAYFANVAELMLPQLRDRPLSWQAYPRGIEGPSFFAKHIPDHFPEWVDRVTVPKRGGTVTHALANDAATLRLLANQNVLTPHVWTSRADRPEQPDRIIWDLDPSSDGQFGAVRSAARCLGELLRAIGLEPYAMVTGSRGVHVVTPIRRGPKFDDVLAFSRAVAGRLVDEQPHTLTTAFTKDNRDGKIFVDVLRNRYAQTAVCAYAIRARPTAPVAVPLRWEELSSSRLDPQRWTVRNLGRRLARVGDAWAGFTDHARAIGPARRALGR